MGCFLPLERVSRDSFILVGDGRSGGSILGLWGCTGAARSAPDFEGQLFSRNRAREGQPWEEPELEKGSLGSHGRGSLQGGCMADVCSPSSLSSFVHSMKKTSASQPHFSPYT